MERSSSQKGGSETPELSVVVPLYNEAEILPALFERLLGTCRQLNIRAEVVFVNDGSSDETLAKLRSLGEGCPEIRILDLFRNFGHMAALTAGIDRSRGEAVVTMDGDLQDPPELIPEMLAKWRGGAEVVYAVRTSRSEPLVKRALTACFYRLLSFLTRSRIPPQVGTFALMDRKVVDVLVGMPEKTRFFAGLRAWIGGRQALVTYERADRTTGRSRVGFQGLMRLARTAFLSFSNLPLRLSSLLSLFAAGLFFLIGVVVIAIRLITNLAIPGWASTMAMIGALGGVQSLVLFFLCEYMAVIFEELKQRPLYVIREEISFSDGQRSTGSVGSNTAEGD